MITSLLIANRGEIACRIIRTARRMGIRTAAVYSDADARALHVRVADEAVHIGASPARESYLVGDKIIAAARATGAEAIHPGYGFLSENADFAQAVIDAGLVWVGPRPQSIRDMGLKDAAKARMIAAGVPVTPGYLGEDQSPATLAAEADKIGYPILIKAVAGGGGKGMRRVEAAAEFADALASCQREAASSFGDDRVLLEKYILSPRHIEVQIFGDTHGNIVHLFERDCSLQRRHQKVIEEAPAPGMDEATREQICGAAICAAKAVDYVGAGTIEFIADASEGLRADRIWFMEMNTRLQVEHPVTEEITGVDLVEWQLRVASGEELPKRQDELSINGWAIEARLYAEDPAKGFLPSVGRLDHFDLGDNSRNETGVEEGDTISTFYDPMIAKLICSAETRAEAVRRLSVTVRDVRVAPVRTNAAFLANLLGDEDVDDARLDTGLIGRKAETLVLPQSASEDELAAGAILLLEILGPDDNLSVPIRNRSGDRDWVANDQSQLSALLGFRVNKAPERVIRLRVDGSSRSVDLSKVKLSSPDYYDYRSQAVWARFSDRLTHLFEFDPGLRGTIGATASSGTLIAPMPGKVTAIDVAPGDTVTKGQRILTLEAMKMEHGLVAPFDGTVAELTVEPGAQVQVDAVLARIAASPPAKAGAQDDASPA